ncbi:glutathione S-transferase N-terminal domain-containing protein [uncultured Caulobacter sp.]|uniref:glutathione S-transferase N-terminal domain-containing protein n=1 Tax=uncultured Caulobacter sp. TaxID=158749 RepID=UPI002627EF4D|nr:glutathione S-transferase N-terminal domain-containing protein [uncultured Caulobacter sp.]
MRLLYSDISPFARKVRVLAIEKGLSDRLTLEVVAPFQDESLRAQNPLCKVPTLILEDGEAVFDSAVIVDCIDGLSEPRLVPASQPARRRALTIEAAADGMGDASILIVRERMRPQGEHRQDLFDRQMRAVNAALDLFVAALADGRLSPDRFEIAEIAVAVQLAYQDVRRVSDWRAGRPTLADWYERVSKRTSMVATHAGVA